MLKTPSDEACITRFQEAVTESGGRWTKERETLLHIICRFNDHFIAEDLLTGLRKKGFQVAITTIYRNLTILVKAGIIRRACLHEEGAGGIRYERVWGLQHHDHLVCSKCNKRIEFSYPAIDILQEAVASEYGFKLESHHLELVGICAKCQQTKKEAK